MMLWFCSACLEDVEGSVWDGWDKETGRSLCEACRKDERPACESCKGAGQYDVGDCEDGVVEVCPECDGTGGYDGK